MKFLAAFSIVAVFAVYPVVFLLAILAGIFGGAFFAIRYIVRKPGFKTFAFWYALWRR